jgi:predicted transcriptional regulator
MAEGKKPKVTIAARISKDLRTALDQLAKKRRRHLSEIITFALEKYVEANK